MQLIQAFINLVLYSNLWIALAAVAMASQTQFLLSGYVYPSPLLGFIFFATLFLYVLHRIIGIEKARPFLEEGRYLIFSRFRNHLSAYAVATGIGAAILFTQLSASLQLASVAPSLMALGYVLPFLSKRKRLRDLSYIKIFLIAIAWSWITVLLPAIELGMSWSIPMVIIMLERAFFIFALALPFDIRDLEVDAYNQVKTFPAKLGYRRTRILGLSCLIAMATLAGLNHHIDVYNNGTFFAIALSGLITFLLIFFADREKHDYYFTGLTDGLMLLQFGLVWGLGRIYY